MAFDIKQFDNELKEVEAWLSKEYSAVHTGKASPQILDGISVNSYGARTPVKNVASISIEDSKTLRISPWDKTLIKEIEKSIVSSDLGLSTSVDDEGLRVIFPQVTTEGKEKLVKILGGRLEEARISIRKVREKAISEIDSMKKDKTMTEDDWERAKENIQKSVDAGNSGLEGIFDKKKNDIMNG
ncbi:ribosome recycling factor [Candidatus Nomurabacteria bacterium]|nr:ribosome recycling factor [Candidatus Nomurabacteria bacterium]USN95005.1 MAG: ribosome recycling factor [Candidatus Nomurabacteria bacterium]